MLFIPDKMSCYVQNHLGLRTEFELSGQIWNFLEKIFYDYPETYFILWRIFQHSAKCSVFLIHCKIEMPRNVEISGWTLSDLSRQSLYSSHSDSIRRIYVQSGQFFFLQNLQCTSSHCKLFADLQKLNWWQCYYADMVFLTLNIVSLIPFQNVSMFGTDLFLICYQKCTQRHF